MICIFSILPSSEPLRRRLNVVTGRGGVDGKHGRPGTRGQIGLVRPSPAWQPHTTSPDPPAQTHRTHVFPTIILTLLPLTVRSSFCPTLSLLVDIHVVRDIAVIRPVALSNPPATCDPARASWADDGFLSFHLPPRFDIRFRSAGMVVGI